MGAPLVEDSIAGDDVFLFLGYRSVPRNSSECVGFMVTSGWSFRDRWGDNTEPVSDAESTPISIF